jgi:DNA-binding Lrp family transcriptional regulator
LDAIDVRIFCEMAFKYLDYSAFEKRHISPLKIGRKLGIDEKTVRIRVQKMEDEGFIKYYEAIPNFSLFGFSNLGMFNFEAEDIVSKQVAISVAVKTPQVVDVYDMVGPAFSLTMAGSSINDTQERADALCKETNLKKAPFKISDRNTQNSLTEPKKLDWKIIDKLRGDAMRSSKLLASELSISPRTAEYRIERLLETRVFYIRAAIDARKQQGLIFYGLLLFIDKEKQSEILKLIYDLNGEKVWSIFTPAPGVVIVNLFAFSVGEPEEAVLKVLKIAGVSRCFLTIFKEMVEPRIPSWIDQAISKKLLNSK